MKIIYCCNCGNEIYEDDQFFTKEIDKKTVFYHKECALKLDSIDTQQTNIKILLSNIVMTTTNNIDGYKVKKYIDIESVEIVLGTGVFSEIEAGIGDIFGLRSNAFEGKLSKAKKTAMNILKYRAYEKGGNAIIGIDIDYTEFSGNRIGLIINGTIVEIEPII